MHELVKEIRRLAKENPDKKAECQYVYEEDLTPCCIVGHALYNLELVAVGELEKQNEDRFDQTSWGCDFSGTTDEQHWISEVQENQDNGATWAQAVEIADKEVFGD